MLVIINLLIFPTNKIYEGQFLVESFLEALLTCWHGQICKFPNLFLCILLFCKFLMYFIVFISYVFLCFYDFFIVCNLILINFKIYKIVQMAKKTK